MGKAAQPATDDLHHLVFFLPDHHVDPASINSGHDPVVYRTCFDLGFQLWLAIRTQPSDPLSATFSNQLKGVKNGKTIN